MTIPRILALNGALSLLTSAAAENRNDRRGAMVILFPHADYSGGALVLYPGDGLDNFSCRTFDNGTKLNDGVSSIRIEGNLELFVYENATFRGEALRLSESVRDLTGRFVKGGVG